MVKIFWDKKKEQRELSKLRILSIVNEVGNKRNSEILHQILVIMHIWENKSQPISMIYDEEA